MTPAAAMWTLRCRGWVPLGVRPDDGAVRFPAPAGDKDTAAAQEALAVLRAHRPEAAALLAWPPESWEAAARFGHGDGLLYPYLGRDVDTPAGPAVLRQVLGGWAIVHRPGAECVERVRVGDVCPPQEATAHAG